MNKKEAARKLCSLGQSVSMPLCHRFEEGGTGVGAKIYLEHEHTVTEIHKD